MEEVGTFAADVYRGLNSPIKKLPSKHLYDAKGDALFQRIMELEEYYPARAEGRILRDRSGELAEALRHPQAGGLNLIELGAGDASKTRYLLRALFQEAGDGLRYIPNDISRNVLDELEWELTKEMPDLRVEAWAGDYFHLLEGLKVAVPPPRVLVFMGGNIGNYSTEEAQQLLSTIAGSLDEGDRLLMGFDLKKDPRRILRAYDDRDGITKAFNLNLLERMNRELGGDFDPDLFIHHPLYDPMDGEVRSYLVSTKEQVVNLEGLSMKVHFRAWEPIFMERSQKYSFQGIDELASGSGFRSERHFEDPNGDFVDSLWVKP